MVLVGAAIHLCYAVALSYDPDVSKITSVHALDEWLPHTICSVGTFAIFSAFSLLGLAFHERQEPRWLAIAAWLMAVPQAALMVFALAGEARAVVAGQYPDGYVPSSRWFIFADQNVYGVITIIHTWAIVRELFRGVHSWPRIKTSP